MQSRKKRSSSTLNLDPRQLSLFESTPQAHAQSSAEVTSLFDFVRARLDYGPEMTPEEYQRWIKVLIHRSLKTLS